MKRVLLAVVLLASACGSDEPSVPWHEYAPEVRERVDAAIDSGDCGEMQQELDAAVGGDEAHRARYDTGNADLMGYILDAMEAAGCP